MNIHSRLELHILQANDMESQRKFPSKSCPLRYGTAKIQEDAKKLFESGLRDFLGSQASAWGVTSLSVTASKILDTPPVSLWDNFYMLIIIAYHKILFLALAGLIYVVEAA